MLQVSAAEGRQLVKMLQAIQILLICFFRVSVREMFRQFRYFALCTSVILMPFMSSFGLQLPSLDTRCQNVLLDATST
jgi:hypothetical protein